MPELFLIGNLRKQNLSRFLDNFILKYELFFVSFIIILYALRLIVSGFDLQSWDEALYAVRAKSIIYFNAFWDQTEYSPDGLYSSTHPPLYIWLTAFAYKSFGINEISTRLFSFISGLFILIFIYLLGKKLFSITTSFSAILILITNPFFIFWTLQGQLDVLLSLFFILSIYIYLNDNLEIRNKYILVGVLIGLSLMTKLFVGLTLLIAIIFFELLNKKFCLKNFSLLILTMALISLPWHISMIIKHSNFDLLFFFKQAQIYERTFYGIENNAKELGLLFYFNQLIVYTPVTFIPFLFYLYKLKTNIFNNFLIFFVIIYFLIISIISTKLPVYIVPILPLIIFIAIHSIIDLFIEIKKKYIIFSIFSLMNILFIWSLNSDFRNEIKILLNHFSIDHIYNIIINYKELLILLIVIEILIFLLYKLFSNNTQIILLSIIIFAYVCNYFYILSFNPYQELNSGINNVIQIIKKYPKKNYISIGHGINPQLSFYTDGIDIGWHKNNNFVRLDPNEGYYKIKNKLKSMINKDPYIIYEKSDYYLANKNSSLFIPEEYSKIIETKEYILYSTK